MSIMFRNARRGTPFSTHGMRCSVLVFVEKQCPRSEFAAAKINRSECHLAAHPGVPRPLNSDRQSTRGQCPNTGGFGLGVPQPLNSDRQRTQGQCLNTGRSNVENRDVWVLKMGLNLTSFARFMELPKGRDMKYSVLVFTGKQCPRSEFSAFFGTHG